MDVMSAVECQNHLHRISQKLSEDHKRTILKVLVVSYGPSSPDLGSPYWDSLDNVSLRVGRIPRRKAIPIPVDPLQKSVARARGRLGG